MKIKAIQDAALALPARSRARLVKRLILTLEDSLEDQSKVEQDWQIEIKRRSDELKTGRVKGVPAGKALENARSALQ